MQDWRSYDGIAHDYDRVWAPRFAAAAREIWVRVPVSPGARVLDIGSGTGIVLRVLSETTADVFGIACDRSAGMLRRARVHLPACRAVVSDAVELPVRSGTVDVVTASFVLSHLHDYPRALEEMRRVLARGGRVAVTNWAAASDPYSAAWNEYLAREISRAEVQRATTDVAPFEDHLSRPDALATALSDAGFSSVQCDAADIDAYLTVEQFLQDREISSTGRLARHLMGPDRWAPLRSAAAGHLAARFGASFHYRRGLLIATADKP